MTVADNIALSILEYNGLSRSAVQRMVRMKLLQVDLEGYGDCMPLELSGGMKKRAGLARAMAVNPKILFLDEPSAGLDPVISVEIDELILHINRTKGTTMAIVWLEVSRYFEVSRSYIVFFDEFIQGLDQLIDQGSQLRNRTDRNVEGLQRSLLTTLDQVEKVLLRMNQLFERLAENPADLLFSQPPPAGNRHLE